MAGPDARPEDGSLRRIRSTGDIPQRPASAHIPGTSRSSQSRYDSPDLRLPLNDDHVGLSSLSPESQSAGGTPWRRWTPPPVITEHPDNAQAQDARPNHFADVHPPVMQAVHRPPLPPLRQHNRSLYSQTMAFFGYGRGASRARRSLVALLWNLTWGFVQIVIIVVVLGLSGSHFKSPTKPEMTEWKACDRPLGVWACLWIVRVVLASGLAYWGFTRDRRAQANHVESEAGGNTRPSLPSQPSPTLPHPPPPSPTSALVNTSPPDEVPQAVTLPYSHLYARLTLLSSLLTLSWFLTAHILQYTSIHTCRESSPHIWWLTFAILCVMYLMVLEVVLLGFVVLIIAPILFVFWNIFLICIGRHPLQNPTMIKHEIDKLPKSVVDRIPLVMYIPPPPDAPPGDGIKVPEAAYSYPPKTPAIPPPPAKRRFRFLRNVSPLNRKKGDSVNSPSTDPTNEKPERSGEPQTWEEHWEQGEYPFVILEGNRAACAICLMDFEEPKKVAGTNVDPPKEEGIPGSSADALPTPVGNITVEQRQEPLKLEDAGEGAQPLRLLACGHVFHKTCLDPWLTDVSGRCPVCQRAVTSLDVPQSHRTRRHRHP